MAWGIWNKIGKGIKKAANWVGNHIGDIADVAETVVDGVAPEFGTVAHAIDGAAHAVQNMVGRNGHGIRRRVY